MSIETKIIEELGLLHPYEPDECHRIISRLWASLVSKHQEIFDLNKQALALTAEADMWKERFNALVSEAREAADAPPLPPAGADAEEGDF